MVAPCLFRATTYGFLVVCKPLEQVGSVGTACNECCNQKLYCVEAMSFVRGQVEGSEFGPRGLDPSQKFRGLTSLGPGRATPDADLVRWNLWP
jgi:hypothetical protein